MQLANIMLAIGGDTGSIISKYRVTTAEIAVLREIHGDDSVTEVQPVGEVAISHRQERQRLFDIYGRATDGAQRSIVETLFPGAAARVFERLEELDLPEDAFAATGRANARTAVREEPVEEAPPAAPTAPAAPLKPAKPLTKAQQKVQDAADAKTARVRKAAETAAAKAAVAAAAAAPAPAEEAEDEVEEDLVDEHSETPPAKNDVLG